MSQQKLIIFSRYPEPGKTKTRLIPALGAEGAAQLQRQMTEDTVKKAKVLQEQYFIGVEVHFVGGNEMLIEEWLGDDLQYVAQVEGDLGQKMAAAFTAAFTEGMQQVVIIGIDCPDLTTELLVQAFRALSKVDLVLGEAADGGYYLIGLSRFLSLFKGISWGTGEVFQKTLDLAKKEGSSFSILPVLNDIDSPEDL